MQRKGWTRVEMEQFLRGHGMTPQVASRRVTEVNRSYMGAMAEAYQELSESDIYDKKTREFYAAVAKEMMNIARKH